VGGDADNREAAGQSTPVTESRLRADVMRPSALGASELAVWHRMLETSSHLQRPFFTPSFALACERATDSAYVAILHVESVIHAFLPFQFKSTWHRRIRLAQRIGGGLSDNAGLIAWPNFRTTTRRLMRLCGLASLDLSHIMEGQEQFGVDAEWSDISYFTDLSEGPEAYFTTLLDRNRHFVRDTERQQRKTRTTYGDMTVREAATVTPEELAGVVAMKRLQYQRTRVGDAFDVPGNLRVIETLRESSMADCTLVLATLEAGGKMLAQHLGLRHNSVLSWWFPVYDISAQAVSPGRLLLWQVIRDAAGTGVRLIDYGAGEAQYKRQFSTGTLRMGRAIWSAANARSLLAHISQSVEWRLRGQYKLKAEPS
jgi:CelD/BcsL family acetyltransferase involved in cellulose biosynthesis